LYSSQVVEGHRSPGQRAGLSRGRVLAAARELLAEEGLAALTMRGLASRLGVAPNALYSHVDSKTALVDAVLDDVLGEVVAPAPDTPDPVAGLHALMASTYEVLLAHPDLVPVYLARQGARGPNARGLGDTMLVLLARAGVEGQPAIEALRVLIVYTIGFAAFDRPRADAAVPAAELAGNFDRGLRWLLAGVTGAGGR
jgi:TetR/AcrR family transcriptional regulator, tetracycline repressor protein